MHIYLYVISLILVAPFWSAGQDCSEITGTTTIIHCWDFNGTTPFSSPIPLDNRVVGDGEITHNFMDPRKKGGSTQNSCAATGSDAGEAFQVKGDGENGNFLTLAFPTTCYGDLSLSFWADGRAKGFDDSKVEYSVDGGATWVSLSTFNPLNGPSIFNFSINDPQAEDNPDFQLRIIMAGAENNGGQSEIDNIKLESSIFLPVEWLSFKAKKHPARDAVQLKWSVAWEELHDYYEVQHSTNGADWSALGRVHEGNPQPLAGSRFDGIHYDFIDFAPRTGLNLYRIRQVDLDGSEDYSTIRKVLFFGEGTDFELAPIPARDYIYFTWPSDWQEKQLQLELVNMQGQRQTIYRGSAPSDLRLSNLTTGMYQLLVRDSQGNILTRKRLVVQ
jgi:hypothetical protein